jgi:hypothetical protein
VALKLLAGRHLFEPAGPARVMAIHLVLPLVAGKYYLFRVDDYHMIADIDMRGVSRLILAHQYTRGLGREPPDGLAACVYNVPSAVLFQILPARNECAHDANLQFSRKEDEQKEYGMAFLLSSTRRKSFDRASEPYKRAKLAENKEKKVDMRWRVVYLGSSAPRVLWSMLYKFTDPQGVIARRLIGIAEKA